jgi:hypothetical protein
MCRLRRVGRMCGAGGCGKRLRCFMYGVSVLPADPEHVAAFVVGRFRAGVGVQALSANLSSVRWFHKRADVSVDVTVGARGVLNLLAKSQPVAVSPAPVLSVGALLAMVRFGSVVGGRVFVEGDPVLFTVRETAATIGCSST